MLEIRATVVQVEGDEALVSPLHQGGCGHCSSSGCGSGGLAKLSCDSAPRVFRVVNRIQASAGDEVRISLPDGMLLRGAAKMYGLPLILILLGGSVGASLAVTDAAKDAYAASGALLGLVLGFQIARMTSFKAGKPVATSILNSKSSF